MKLKLLLAASLMSCASNAESLRTTDFQQSLNANAPRNYIVNSGAEKNVTGVTDVSNIHSRTTFTALEGAGSHLVNATAASELVVFQANDLQAGLVGRTCEAVGVYTGDASLYKAYVTVAGSQVSDTLAMINAGTNTQKFSIIFPCGASTSDDPALVIESTGDGAEIKLDSVYLGEAISLSTVSQARFLGSLQWAITAGCTWDTNQLSFAANFANDTDCDNNARTINGIVTDASSGLRPAIGVPYQGPGLYKIFASGSFGRTNGAATNAYFRFFDGTNQWGTDVLMTNGAAVLFRQTDLTGELLATAAPAGGSYTVDIQAYVGNTSADAEISSSTAGMRLSVYYFPTVSQTVISPVINDLSGFAKSAATTNCAWQTTSSSLAAFAADSNCPTITTIGNLTAPTTKIPGFIANTILPGRYLVTASTQFDTGQSTAGTASCSWEIYDGISSGGVQRQATQVSTGTSNTATITGFFEYTAKQNNILFQIRGRRDTGNQNCTVDAAVGDLTFTLIPISQALSKPFIPGSVYAERPSVVKLGAASVNCSSSSTIVENPDGMLASVGNVSSGTCDVTFTTGYFSSAPICVGNTDESIAGTAIISTKVNSATSLTWRGTLPTGSTSSTPAGNLICIGN